jgi:hypothetical protein
MEDVRCPHSHVPGEVNNQRVSNGRGKHIMSWEQRAGGGAATLRNIAGRQAGRHQDEVGLLLLRCSIA